MSAAMSPLAVGEVLEVRRSVGGKTVVYIVKVGAGAILTDDLISVRGEVVKAVNQSATCLVDDRLQTQRESISRLLTHLKEHCPSLNGSGRCDHVKDDM